MSTYRLQFNRYFTFRDAAKLVPYLHELGITDCYVSPYLKARPGSLHGYDITDYNMLNPEIGSREDYDLFMRKLHRYGIGQILDFVPNHMGIFDNPWWQHVLENGPCSLYAPFFDIDWDPLKAELRQKVLLPILEDLYGNVLERGELRLVFERGAFGVRYQGQWLPIDPKTAPTVLGPCLQQIWQALGEQSDDSLELQSIITACHNLPSRDETKPEQALERHREKEVIKSRLWRLCRRNPAVQAAVDETVRAFNGIPGENATFDRLHGLLEQQAYRLSYWRVAAEEINYRRFFDVNDLVAIRMEDPRVFEASHKLVWQLLREGLLTGIRVDHVDGLFDPADYLWRLQKAYFLELCRREVERRHGAWPGEQKLLENKLVRRLEREAMVNPSSAAIRPLFVVVEKILVGETYLRETWPVHGTTGYEFAMALNGVFVDETNARALLNIYRRFTGRNLSFWDILYQSKGLVMHAAMSGEVNVLAHQLNRISERSRRCRDFTLNSLRDAMREVIACWPTYRTYIDAYSGSVDARDEVIVGLAVIEAKRRNPAISSAIFDFVRDTLLLQYPLDMSEEGRAEQQLFVMRFQQFTGPVMAKGMEDTAFYIYNPLVSLNEVGGFPQRFGVSTDGFHEQNLQRLRTMPHSLVATSTHDSKRSEDVRARINVLSEVPEEWRSALARWSRLNRRKKAIINDEPVPDRNEEYLLYQTLLGTYPVKGMNDEALAQYCSRIRNYMLKAIREAKVHTSWVSPNSAYEEGVLSFVRAILDPSASKPFLTDFRALNKLVATCGMHNSLSQTLLKIFSPGVPDTYQGNELLEFSLVDPDNRQPVDFPRRIHLLKRLKKCTGASQALAQLAQGLLKRPWDGQAKMYVTWRSLTYRREHAALFYEGTYVPLKAAGPKKDRLCAFAWRERKKELVVLAPRLIAGLTGKGATPPTGSETWGDTSLTLQGKPSGQRYRNIFTGETVEAVPNEDQASLPLAEVFKVFPVAALELIPL